MMSINLEFTKGFSYDRNTGDLWLANGAYSCPLGVGPLGSALGSVDRLQGDGQGLQLVPAGHYRLRHRAAHGDEGPQLEVWNTSEWAKAPICRIVGGIDRTLRITVADLIAVGFTDICIWDSSQPEG